MSKPKFTPSFELLTAPAAQAVPDWISDLTVEWMDQFSNVPTFKLKVEMDVGTWPNQVYRKEGSVYIAESGDGRRHELFHNGPVSMVEVRPGVIQRATTQQDGFGGSHIELMMDDGQKTVLRGPWSGSPPQGWSAASYVWLGAPWHCGVRVYRDWTRETATAGIFFSNELIVAAVRKYAPEVQLALVKRYSDSRSRLEPLKPDWTAPKGWAWAMKAAA